MTLTWSPGQEKALAAISAWLKDPNGKQTFYLAGHAGTGKTACLQHALADVKGTILYGAFTGRAASVMRRAGLPTATTIHKLIYSPAGDPPSPAAIEKLRMEVKRLYAINEPGARATADRMAEQLARAEQDGKRTGPRFTLNLNSDLRSAKLCVIDECSFVDARIGADLESFGTKILVVGDPAQLPPIYGAGYFTSREPDAYLHEIHRQELDSPILYLADLARRGERLPYGKHGDCEVLRSGDPSLEHRVLKADIVIVGRNRTRHASNAKIRRLLGHPHEAPPVAGERVICLRNDHELGFLNGTQWIVDRCVPDLDRMTAHFDLTSTDDGTRVECDSWLHHFFAREEELKNLERRKFNEVDAAYCVTGHKAQGGSWENVIVFDESAAFGRDADRWRYTSITRASKTIQVVQ